MIIEEVASVGNVFWVLRIGMKKIFILIGCVKCILQDTKKNKPKVIKNIKY